MTAPPPAGAGPAYDGTKTMPMAAVAVEPSSLTPLVDVADVVDGSSGPPAVVEPESDPNVVAAAADEHADEPSPSASARNMTELVFAKASPEIDWAARRASSRPPPAAAARVSSRPPPVGDEDEDAHDHDYAHDHDDDDDDAHHHGPAHFVTGPQWVEDAAEDERPPPQRVSGRTVALALMAVTVAFAALALYARSSYRGDHDNQTGLGLPLRDGGATTTAATATGTMPTAVAVSTTATVAPVVSAPVVPPVVSAPVAPPVVSAPVAVAPSVTAAPRVGLRDRHGESSRHRGSVPQW